MSKMTPGELVRMALIYAIQDRESFAGCNAPGTPERAEALDEVRQFKAYLKRRFNTLSIDDQFDAEFKASGGKMVPIHEIMPREKFGK